MNCPNCGAQVEQGQKFCSSCGAPLPKTQEENQQKYEWDSNNIRQTDPYVESNKRMANKESFSKRPWFMILICIFLPPAGIVLCWINKKPKNKIARILLTIFLLFYSISWCSSLFGSSSEKDSSKDSTTSQSVESTQDTQEAEENKNDETAQTEEPQLSPDEYKAQCQDVNYNDIMRNPDQFIGQKFKITVQVSSVSHKMTAGTYYKAYTDDGSGYYFDKMIWVFDKRDEDSDGYVKILEDDIVTFYGEFNGLQETKNALNNEKGEDFALDAYYVDIVQEAQ